MVTTIVVLETVVMVTGLIVVLGTVIMVTTIVVLETVVMVTG